MLEDRRWPRVPRPDKDQAYDRRWIMDWRDRNRGTLVQGMAAHDAARMTNALAAEAVGRDGAAGAVHEDAATTVATPSALPSHPLVEALGTIVADLVATLHRPSPRNPDLTLVAPGKHREFERAIKALEDFASDHARLTREHQGVSTGGGGQLLTNALADVADWLSHEGHGIHARTVRDGVTALRTASPQVGSGYPAEPEPLRTEHPILAAVTWLQREYPEKDLSKGEVVDAYARHLHEVLIAFVAAEGPFPSPAPNESGRTREAPVRIVRHKKRGSVYEVLGEAELQLAKPDAPMQGPDHRRIYEEDRLTVYRSLADGKLWCRFPDEFEDGRFEDTPPQAGESGRTREGGIPEGYWLAPIKLTEAMADAAVKGSRADISYADIEEFWPALQAAIAPPGGSDAS